MYSYCEKYNKQLHIQMCIFLNFKYSTFLPVVVTFRHVILKDVLNRKSNNSLKFKVIELW